MNFLNHSLTTIRNFKPYIKIKELPNIHIVPYVHKKLLFSQLVCEALKNNRYKSIIIDTPRFMQAHEWVDRPIRNYPEILTYHFQYEKKYFYYTFAPNEAHVAVMIMARIRNIPYYCIDDPVYLYKDHSDFFNPYIKLKDENFIYENGIEEYFERPRQQLNNLWQDAADSQKSLTLCRAVTIIERLRQLTGSGKQFLFVCEYRMWWTICKIMREIDSVHFPPSYPFIFEDVNFAVSYEDPYLLWTRSELDDYPAIVYDFYKSIMDDSFTGSTIPQELDIKLSHFFLDEKRAKTRNISTRRLLKFKQYLQNLMILNGRILPLPAKHLLHAAQSCLGKVISETLARDLLSYPLNDAEKNGRNVIFFKYTGDGFDFNDSDIKMDIPDILDEAAYFDNLLDEVFSTDANESLRERINWIDRIHKYATKQEDAYFENKYNQLRWDVSVDKILHYQICTNIREMLMRKQNRYVVKRNYGSLKDGLDIKATIASIARNENALYIKENIPRWRNQNIVSQYSPVVFIFTEEKQHGFLSTVREENVTLRMRRLQMSPNPHKKYPAPKVIYASYRKTYETKNFLNGHLSREKVSALALNSVSKYLEFNRYYEVAMRPEKFLPRLSPEEDNDIIEFHGHDKIVAWTLKYAEFSTIVYAYDGWQPSVQLTDFARIRNKRILVFPITTFSADFLDRLSTCHYISVPLKNHKNREQILRRFIK